MKQKRFLALFLAIFLITALFAGCSKASSVGNMAAMDGAAMENELVNSAESTSSITPQNQKLIRTLYIDAETEDMDPLLENIDAKIAELGGYVESRQVDKASLYSSSNYRRASLKIRIPADKLDSFVSLVSDQSNITSNRETTDDVTLKYVATESRITALETEQTRLLELLAKAEDMNDLLLIESRLTQVRTELEQVKSTLRVYDNLVSYGTIHLELIQVEKYTEPEPETFWERISTGFMTSLQGVGDGIVGFVVFLIVSLPYLVVFGAITVAVVLICKHRKKKKAQKKQTEE